MRVCWQYSFAKGLFYYALKKSNQGVYHCKYWQLPAITWAVLAPEPLRSASQWSLDPSWQGFEPKKRYHLLIELRYTSAQAPNTHIYSFSAVPTKDPNRESMSLLCSLKAARDNCITIFIFVSITH